MRERKYYHSANVRVIALVSFATCALIFSYGNTNGEDFVVDGDLANTKASKEQGLEQNDQPSSNHESFVEVLNELVKIDSNFQRSASLYAFLADVNESDLIDLLHQTESIESTNARLNIQKLVVQKLASVDPDQALDWITSVPKLRRDPLLKGLFHDWSITNLMQAAEGAKSLRGTDRSTALEVILSTRKDVSVRILRDIAKELGLEEFARRHMNKIEALQLLEEPSSAWDLLVNDDFDDTKQLAELRLVASAWKKMEGFDVLLQVSSLFPDENDRKALSTVIEDIVGTELGDAFDFVRNLSPKERGELPSALAMVAARVNPEVALEEIAAWSHDPIHVHLQRIVSTTWAKTDPRGMLDKLELVPQIARRNALKIAFTHLAYVSPTEAIRNLKRANEFLSAKGWLPAIIVNQWSQTDPKAAFEWSISYADSNSELREYLLRNVLANLVESDIDKAIEISGEIDSIYISFLDEASYDVVKKLIQMGKIEEAFARLPLLNKNARHFAMKDLGWVLVRAGEPFAAIELGANVPTPDPDVMVTGPASYFNSVLDEWVSRDPQQLFESLRSFTSPWLRSLAARSILDHQNSRPTLSQESIEYVEALLNKKPETKNLHRLELQLQDEQGLIDLDQIDLPSEGTE